MDSAIGYHPMGHVAKAQCSSSTPNKDMLTGSVRTKPLPWMPIIRENLVSTRDC